MPINVRKGENESEFISRCIADEVSAGKENEVAAAICYSYWRKEEMKSLRTSEERFSAKLKFQRDFKGINLLASDLEDACWPGYTAVGTKDLGGRQVPNCVPDEEGKLESVMPQIESSYAGQGPDSGSVRFQDELNIFGYQPRNFDICPGAIALFTHLVGYGLGDDEETIGMIRSAAIVADEVFRVEKEVLESKTATAEQLQAVIAIVEDFKDIIHEIDEEVGMVHDVSFMDGHIKTISEYFDGNE